MYDNKLASPTKFNLFYSCSTGKYLCMYQTSIYYLIKFAMKFDEAKFSMILDILFKKMSKYESRQDTQTP